METCETEHGEGRLQLCKNSLGQLDPQGKIIEHCCLEEPAFQNCLEKCYLEEKQAKFRNCLQECLNKKAEETGIDHPS